MTAIEQERLACVLNTTDFKNVKFKDAKLYKENERYSIKVTYIEDNDNFVKEFDVAVPLYFYNVPSIRIDHSVYDSKYTESNICVDMGFGFQEHAKFEARVLEVKEMSIDEIEKALCCKIKIINKS